LGDHCSSRRRTEPKVGRFLPDCPVAERLPGLFLLFKPPGCSGRGYRSDAEEREPDGPENQYRKPGRDGQEGKHRRTRFGLACFGRGFDDPALWSRCHGALDSLMSRTPAGAGFEANARSKMMFRIFAPMSARGSQAKPVRRGASCNQPAPPRLTPMEDSLPARLESGFPGGIVAGRLLRVRSIPWPPVRTGKAFCAFRW
jgi:hypothetical protein